MEHKFANIQTAFDFFINTGIKGNKIANKNKHGERFSPHPNVRSKSNK